MTRNNLTERTDGGPSRRTILKTVGVSAAVATGVSGMGTVGAASGTYTSNDYAGRYYGKYLPSSYDGSEPVPLVMMLHGCSQNADGFKDETQMNQVAEENGFIAVYPEENEGIYSCWNWFEKSNTRRGQGQAQELAEGIVGQVKRNENVDEDRVYVAGFSAGAYMVPNLVAEYADVFAAGGIHSGGMYGVAESQVEGNNVISDRDCSDGTSSDPQVEGENAYENMESYGIDQYQVPTVVFHGSDDGTVTPCNGDEAVEQATETNDLLDDDADDGSVDYTADDTDTGSGPSLSYTEYVYENSEGEPVVDYYVVDGMTHAWSGGSSGGTYTAPGGPNASQIIWDYFKQWSNSPNDAPNAAVQASADAVSTGESVTFDGSGSADPDGTIQSYEWDFGDGATAAGVEVSHSYESTGTYTVTLTVTDGRGATDTAAVDVQVCDGNCPPDAAVSASPTTATTAETVEFDASDSADVDGSIQSYEWDFGDGATATGATAAHQYDSTGTYTATVTVTDDSGATDSASVEITVESALYCGTATNGDHVEAGRAYNSGGCYYAEGSDTYLGCMSATETTLEETSTGYYEEVSSCPDGGSDGGDDGGDDSGYCGTATNSDHVSAGRAYTSWGYYYADGSDDYLGFSGASETTLKETSDGYYEQVDSC